MKLLDHATLNGAQRLLVSLGAIAGRAQGGKNYSHRKSGPGRRHRRGPGQMKSPAQGECMHKPHCWERTK